MKRHGSVRWALIAWLFVISAVAYLDRVNISIAGKMIAAEYGFTNQQLGWVFSSFVMGYALFQAPSGRIADRFGARRALALAAVWWAVFSALSALLPAFALVLPALILVRFALGAGESIVYPAANRIVAQWIPVPERGLANGLIFMGVGVGAGITPPLITAVMLRYGWRASFIVCGLIGLAAGAVWLIIARDSPDGHRWVSETERAQIRAGIPARGAEEPLRWRVIAANRNVRFLTLSYFCYGYSAYIFFTWFFIYLSTVRGLDLKVSAVYAMLPFLAMAVGSGLGGLVSDRLTKRYGRRIGRCGLAGVGIGLAALFIAAGTQVESARLATLVLAGGAGTLYLAQSSFWSVSADIAGSSAGAVSGVMNMGAQLGGVVTASLTPWVADRFGWTGSFLVAAGLCVVGAAAWIGVRPEEPVARI